MGRPGRDLKTKKPSDPDKRRMKARNSTSPAKTLRGLASSFSLTEKSAPLTRGHDERNPTGILTSGFVPRSRLPSFRLVAVGVCNPLQWRNRPRFSRGSLTLDCY